MVAGPRRKYRATRAGLRCAHRSTTAVVHRHKRIIRTLVERGADTTRAMHLAERGLAGDFEDVPASRGISGNHRVTSRAWRQIAFRPRMCCPAMNLVKATPFARRVGRPRSVSRSRSARRLDKRWTNLSTVSSAAICVGPTHRSQSGRCDRRGKCAALGRRTVRH